MQDTSRLQARLRALTESTSSLDHLVSSRSADLQRRNSKLAANLAVVESCAKKLAQRQQQVSVSDYLQNPEIWDTQLSMLHPLRRLRSAVTSLQQKRKDKCRLFLSFFPESESLELPTEELTREVSFTFATHILVIWSSLLDVALPFPIALGSQSTSAALPNEEAFLPRLLHPALRRVVLLDPRGGNRFGVSLANKLFSENLEAFAMMWGATRGGGDLLEYFARLLNAPVFGHPLALPRIRLQPPSEFKDERISVDHPGHGSEWTLLNANQS